MPFPHSTSLHTSSKIGERRGDNISLIVVVGCRARRMVRKTITLAEAISVLKQNGSERERERDKGGEVLVFLDLIVTFGREFENGGRLDGEASTWLSYKVSETG